MTTKAYSYVRFSTADQINGDSQRRQTEAAAKWCKDNGVELVEKYSDLGVSAFRGKNAQQGALGAFLALVKAGRIAKGSFLIVESLDRISREEIMEAFDLFRGIIKSGIIIVTISDGHVYSQEKINSNFTDLIISLTVMSRAHEESKIKSMRISSAWETKRRNVSAVKMTGKCVAWLRLADDRKRFEPIPERVKVVRRIFEMAAGGHGANSIAKILQREHVDTFGCSNGWHLSYVKKILDNRAVIGEFAPATKSSGKRTFLDAVPNYYPAVVDRAVFAAVQQKRKARPSYQGRSSFNVFSKLAFDRATGSSMVYVNKNRAKGWHYLVPADAINGKAKYCAWQYDEFLSYFLFVCHKAATVKAPTAPREGGKLEIARMELDETEKQIGRLVEFLIRGQAGSVELKLRQLELRKKELMSLIRDLENDATAKPVDMGKIDWKDTIALRENLRATVKRIVMDAKAKWFQAEFFDGRVYQFSMDADGVTIETPDKPEQVVVAA